MNSKRTLQFEVAILVGLGLFLLNAACQQGQNLLPTELQPNPESAGGFVFVSVDVASDGAVEDSVNAPIAAGPAGVVVASAADSATGTQAVVESNGDADSAGISVKHTHADNAATTDASVFVVFTWNIDTALDPAEFTLAYYEVDTGAIAVASNLSSATVDSECGGPVVTTVLDAGNPQQLARPEVANGATACSGSVTLNTRLESVGGAGSKTVNVRVTARDVAPTQCANSLECPSSAPFCDPVLRVCGDGGQAAGCVVPSNDCDPLHVFCVNEGFGPGCSNGIQAPCAFDGQCAAGSLCTNNWCTPVAACNSASDCAPGENCLYGGTCAPAPQGEPGSGCFDGRGCVPAAPGINGICQNRKCIQLASFGQDCTTPFTQCAGGLFCAAATGTCDLVVDSGGVCSEDNACRNGATESCVIGICAPRSGQGGWCDSSRDCLPPLTCDSVAAVCQ